ncbi:unnamed protein product [Schistosoma guineensis]|nr:unnamed protein product [Schistosoma guineensis]
MDLCHRQIFLSFIFSEYVYGKPMNDNYENKMNKIHVQLNLPEKCLFPRLSKAPETANEKKNGDLKFVDMRRTVQIRVCN